MKTVEMEIALMRHFDITRNLIVPNVSDWSTLINFEADLLVITKSGYASCIEIKVSKSDLKADLKKKHIKALNENISLGKSGIERYYRSLKYFYYAVPENLVETALEQIPLFSGLYVVKRSNNKNLLYYNVECVRPAKEIFKRKWSDSEMYSVARLGTMRLLGLKESVFRLIKEKKQKI